MENLKLTWKIGGLMNRLVEKEEETIPFQDNTYKIITTENRD